MRKVWCTLLKREETNWPVVRCHACPSVHRWQCRFGRPCELSSVVNCIGHLVRADGRLRVCVCVSLNVKFGLFRTTVSTCQVIIKTLCTAHGITSGYYKNIYLKLFRLGSSSNFRGVFKSPVAHPAKNYYITLFSLHYWEFYAYIIKVGSDYLWCVKGCAICVYMYKMPLFYEKVTSLSSQPLTSMVALFPATDSTLVPWWHWVFTTQFG